MYWFYSLAAACRARLPKVQRDDAGHGCGWGRGVERDEEATRGGHGPDVQNQAGAVPARDLLLRACHARRHGLGLLKLVTHGGWIGMPPPRGLNPLRPSTPHQVSLSFFIFEEICADDHVPRRTFDCYLCSTAAVVSSDTVIPALKLVEAYKFWQCSCKEITDTNFLEFGQGFICFVI